MPGDISKYLGLVTSEHNQQPNFLAVLTAALQPFGDIQAQLATFPTVFDVDVAVGNQLDIIGQWVGRSRFITEPIPNVFFSFDTSGLGFDQGTWFGPGDATSGLVALPDDAYRTLLKGVIASDHWDGTVPGAYAAWKLVFDPAIYTIQITDNQDMTMVVTLIGPTPDAVTLALFTGGYLGLVPAGVSVSYVHP